MTAYVGIDEAGLGPKLGPLVTGYVALKASESFEKPKEDRIDFFTQLSDAVSRKANRAEERIIVADSKLLFSGKKGLRRLEEAWIPFYLTQKRTLHLPGSLSSAIRDIVILVEDRWEAYPWYESIFSPATDALEIPFVARPQHLSKLAKNLAGSMAKEEIEFAHLGALVIPVAAINRSLEATKNKADTAFLNVQLILQKIWREHGDEGVVACVDKQGGRIFYRKSIEGTFGNATVEALTETPDESQYLIRHDGRKMLLTFCAKADSCHFATSLASTIAKYVREILMLMQNRWFSERDPGLRATAGYPEDAVRWLCESSSLRKTLSVDDYTLVRNR